MNIRSNSNFKSVELFDGEIDIYTLIKQPDFTIHASSERSERFRKALELNETNGIQEPFDRIFRVDKKHEDGTVETRVAYEVSIASMEIPEKETDETSENSEEVV